MTVKGEHHRRRLLGVVRGPPQVGQPVGERVGGEDRREDRRDRAEAERGEQRDQRLGDQADVERHAVTDGDAGLRHIAHMAGPLAWVA